MNIIASTEKHHPASFYDEKRRSEDNIILQRLSAELKEIIAFVIYKNNEYQQEIKNKIEDDLKRMHEIENKIFNEGYASYLESQQKLQQDIHHQRELELLQQKIAAIIESINLMILDLKQKIIEIENKISTLSDIYSNSADYLTAKVCDYVDLLPIEEFKSHDGHEKHNFKEFLKGYLIDTVCKSLKEGIIQPQDFIENVGSIIKSSAKSFVRQMTFSNAKDEKYALERTAKITSICADKIEKNLQNEEEHINQMQHNHEALNSHKQVLETFKTEVRDLEKIKEETLTLQKGSEAKENISGDKVKLLAEITHGIESTLSQKTSDLTATLIQVNATISGSRRAARKAKMAEDVNVTIESEKHTPSAGM